jgi:hypothetical protein
MSASAATGTLAARVAGHETAERRRRMGLTRRALAGASGVEATRLAGHEEGRIALDAEELRAIDGGHACKQQHLQGLQTRLKQTRDELLRQTMRTNIDY